MDIFSCFWKKIKYLAQDGKISSIDKVRNELYAKKDNITDWCDNNLPRNFFSDSNEDSLEDIYQKISLYIKSSTQYTKPAQNDFLEHDCADPWLITHGIFYKKTIITYEVSAPESKSKIKIPDVFNYFKVKYKDPIKMLRDLNEVI